MATAELLNLGRLDQLEWDALAVIDRMEHTLAVSEDSDELMAVRNAAESAAVTAMLRGLRGICLRFTNIIRRAEIRWVKVTPRPGRGADGFNFGH